MRRHYIIVAGPNGAGKSTLYRAIPELFAGSQRVNADEILRKNGGDWRNVADNGRAMKEVIRTMDTNIQSGVSFHQETTLAGSTKGYIRRIAKAREQGFQIKLIYVGLASPALALERVQSRVMKGGHGIEPGLLKKRYYKSLEHLAELMSYCDGVFIFDNSDQFVPIYSLKNGQVLFDESRKYSWLGDLLDKK